jgi:hypothetical protein
MYFKMEQISKSEHILNWNKFQIKTIFKLKQFSNWNKFHEMNFKSEQISNQNNVKILKNFKI